jgi:hypothetical protein
MLLDAVVEAGTRRVANRVSRRAFLGRLGGALVAVGTGGSVFWSASPAQADSCGCTHSGHSTSCVINGCPSGSWNCGAWYVCTSNCVGGERMKKYLDCCKTSCTQGCGSDGYPRCCYDAPYMSGTQKVYCRAAFCTNYTC